MADTVIKGEFRGLNTDQPINRLRSGTGRDARNVMWDGLILCGRAGFDEWCNKSVGSSKGVLKMAVFPTGAGEVYVVLKADDGKLYYAKRYTGSAALAAISAWTAITDQWSGHNSSDAGSLFTAEDRIHYFDRVGGSKWHPTTSYKPNSTYAGGYTDGSAAYAWKVGIQSTQNTPISVGEGGSKEGFYRTVLVKKDSKTDAVSTFTDNPQESAVETRASGGTYGGLSVSQANWRASRDKASDLAYEWDTAVVLSTFGNTETKLNTETPSFQFFTDIEVARKTDAALGMNKADHVLYSLSRGRPFANSGGCPPACLHADFNGSRAVYAETYYSGSVVPGQIWYSITRWPCMVPGDHQYTVGGDKTTITGRPWKGLINQATTGTVTGLGHVGRRFVVFTPTEAFWLAPLDNDGRLVAMGARVSGGCVSHSGCVTTAHGVHAVGRDAWMFASGQGIADIARDRFKTLLQEIPSAQRGNTVAGSFPYRHEVWMAVARTNYDCDYIMVHDGAASTYQAIASSSSNANMTYNFQLFSNTAHASDVAYFGWTAAAATTLTLAINRPATYSVTEVLTWEYYDSDESDWVELDISADTTDPDVGDGTEAFVDDGTITFSVSGTWGTTTINSQSAYWIRCKPGTGKAGNITQTPILTPAGPSRILVFDEARGELMTKLDPRNLLGASIKAMCELSTPAEGPIMLIGLSDGRILSWPSSNYYDSAGDDTFNYSTYWRGFFGQERRHRDIQIVSIGYHMGANAAGLSTAAGGVRTGADTHTEAVPVLITAENEMEHGGVTDYDPEVHGNMVQLTLSTTASETAEQGNDPEWEVEDVLLYLGTTD